MPGTLPAQCQSKNGASTMLLEGKGAYTFLSQACSCRMPCYQEGGPTA